ncbi:CBU_0592 family membrane protein [Flectobacillus major]|jgi:formate hydrogenlyase subunit 3/multisubunit Na+/H+ antiporter MnhD subunit|uniref:CBU_0592 family membrane protein n=1 Tax=Flectobacillus major TaxID=103 RepID=UPI0004077000|nr:hypothetical protein [Flectobacillus major]
MEILIEILGWIGSVLIVGAYAFNMQGKLKADSPLYIWSNLLGGIFFVVNTLAHKAYPSAMVNVVWVFIAIYSIIKARKAKSSIK